MKKLLALFLVIALMLTSCIALISCNGNDQIPGGGDDKDDSRPNYEAMEPAELFKSVVLEAVTTGTDGYFSVFEKLLSASSANMAASGSVDIEVSSLLLQSVAPGLNIGKISADYDVSSLSDLGAKVDLDLSCGDVELGKLEGYYDSKTSDIYVALPGLAEGTLKVNLNELMGLQGSYDDYEYDDSFDYDDFDYSDFDDVYVDEYPASSGVGVTPDIMAILEFDLLPYITEIKDYIPHATGIALEKITDVTKNTSTITANGVSAEATVLSTVITAQNFYDMAAAVLDDLASNAEIKVLIEKLYTECGETLAITESFASSEEFYNEFKEAIVSAKESLDEELRDYDGNEAITLNIYLTSDYLVSGLDILAPEGFEYKVLIANSEGKLGGEIKATVEGQKVSMLIDGIEADGMLSGKMTANMMDMDIFTVEFSGIDQKKAESGIATGKYIFSFSDNLGDMAELPIAISSAKLEINVIEVSDSKAEFSVALLMAGFDVDSDTTLVKLSFVNENKEAKSFNFPTDTVSDPETWIATLKLEELMSRLKAIGIPEDMLGGMMY